MGVYILMDIIPDRINDTEWENVYNESLELIRAYPFLDKTVDKDTYGENWVYVERTKEMTWDWDGDGSYVGWHVIGDERSMLIAESFALAKDINYYRRHSSKNSDIDDILTTQMEMVPHLQDAILDSSQGNVTIFDAKTQGYPHHTPLLAIACLLESRFPYHAIVYGDVTLAQMQEAVDWANSVLNRPIRLPERADDDQLIYRIRKLLKDEIFVLKAFHELTLHNKDVAFGDKVRSHFPPEIIFDYFVEQFGKYNTDTIGYQDSLSSYINQGFSLDDLCDICVLNDNGCKHNPLHFAKMVLSLNWNTGKKGMFDDFLSTSSSNSKVPETVPSMMGKFFLKMAGFQEKSKSTLTYEEVCVFLKNKLGNICDLDPLLDSEPSQDDLEDKLLQLLEEWSDEEEGEEPVDNDAHSYDVVDLDDLLQWKQGETIYPGLEKVLRKLKTSIDNYIETEDELVSHLTKLTIRERQKFAIRQNKYFYIHKQAWDSILENMDDTRYMITILYILTIEADEINRSKLCKALINNQDLLKTYIL